MQPTDNAPLNPHGPFIRNVQPVTPGLWIADAQNGTKGKGKVWRPTIIAQNLNHVPGSSHWHERYPFTSIGEVKPSRRSGLPTYFHATICFHQRYDPVTFQHPIAEAFFPTEDEAIRFLITVCMAHQTPTSFQATPLA